LFIERTCAPNPMLVRSVRFWITFSRPPKAPPQMKRMLVVSTCTNSWFGCLRPPCGGTEAIGAFDQLQERLLHALAGDVARDRRVVALAGDLVDLVDVDDAALRLLDVVVALLQELLDDVLDVLADVARFRERRCIRDHEGDVEQARERLREERLAGAGGADEQDVRLGELDIVLLAAGLQALVVVVDRDREDLLGLDLADHVLVEDLADLVRAGKVALLRLLPGVGARLFTDDVVAEVDALVADEYRRTGDELADFMLALAAEGAVKKLFPAHLVRHVLLFLPRPPAIRYVPSIPGRPAHTLARLRRP
jgi:hypothetical protein